MQLLQLVEDPQTATIRGMVQEAKAMLPQQRASAVAAHAPAGVAHAWASTPAATPARPVGPLWVSPAPVSVKMRLFCLPYAGGVSENVYARWAGRRGGCGVGSTPGF